MFGVPPNRSHHNRITSLLARFSGSTSDRRVCLFLPDGDGCIIVTLDLPPAVLRVQVDTFLHVHGFGSRHARLLNVDELELSDDHSPLLKNRRLTHEAEGTWRLDGVPYQKNVRSKVSTVPLPPLQDVKRNDPVVIEPRRADRNQRYRAAIRLLKPPSATANLEPPWGLVATGSYVPGLPLLMVTQDRLQIIRDGLSKHCPVKLGAEIGTDIEMPSMRFTRNDDQFQIQNGMQMLLSSFMAIRLFRYDPSQHHGWITLADMNMPCYDTDYHRGVRKISGAYESWKTYYDSHLIKSMRSPDDLGFLQVIDWYIYLNQWDGRTLGAP